MLCVPTPDPLWKTMRIKRYSEMIQIPTFEDRYEYLKLGGAIGAATFGSSRYINQWFYQSSLWRSIRNEVILRDNGCDLGDPDRVIHDQIHIHHMNPINEDDVEVQSEYLLNSEFLICTSRTTHNAIHFGDAGLLFTMPVERCPNDTSPWRM
jgi:hypothetical protein